METTIVLYRKLALRSQLKFGKFEFETVQTLIQLGQQEYLKWAYYNMSNIDFLPDVKAAIGIDKDIEKPGVDKEYWEDYKKRQHEIFVRDRSLLRDWDTLTEEEKLECYKRSAIKKRNQRIKRERAEAQQNHREYMRELSAKQLQGINHGHGAGRKRDLGNKF